MPGSEVEKGNESIAVSRDEGAGAETKLQYLGFIQAIIARMSNYSCAIKGSCCVVLIGLVTAFSQACVFKGSFSAACLVLIIVSTAAMSAFDAKYLQLERQYRALYSLIDGTKNADYPTDLKPCKPNEHDKTRKRDAYFSWSVLGFYLSVCIVGVVCWAILTFG